LRGEGSFYGDVGDYQRAESAIGAWVARYPRDVTARYQLAGTRSVLGRYEDAINQFEACLGISNHYGSRHRLIRLYMLRQDRGRAQEQLEAMRASGPATAVAYNDAWFAFVDGHPDEALKQLQRLSTMGADEWSAAAGYIAACVYAEWGRDAEAAKVLTDRLRGGTGLTVHLSGAAQCLGLAAIYLRMKDRKSAVQWAREALARDSGPKIVMVAATLLARAGEPGPAAETARLLDPFPALPLFEIARARCRGEIDLARGAVGSGLAQLESAARLSPPGILVDYLARAHAAVGDRRRAAQLYEGWLEAPAWLWRAPETGLPGAIREIAEGAASLRPGIEVKALKTVLQSMPFLASAMAVKHPTMN
jgi:tetratricopeptide (TPR) repeat protein